MQKQLIESKIKKAVDWKIFEIQSLLISEDADLGTINDSLLWLQPKHYLEVVEERVNDDRCGYPLCTSTILNNKFKKGTYRIDYNNQKVYTIDQSHLYCSNQCIEKSQLLEMRFDVSSPYCRSVVNSLDINSSVVQKSSIDDILTLLGPDANSYIKNTRNDTSISNLLFKGSTVMNENGEVQVDFHEGVPIVIPNTIKAENEDKIIKNSTTSNLDNLSTSKFDIKNIDLIQNSLGTDDDFEAPCDTDDCKNHHPTKTIVYHTFTNKNLSASTSAEPSNVEEILATMNELQEKYKLKKGAVSVPANSTINEISVGNRFTNGSLLKNDKNNITKKTHSQTTVRSEGVGSRKGAKSVSWDSVIERQPSSTNNVKQQSNTIPMTIKRTMTTIPVQFEIKERSNPHVMSEAAMMLKQEVPTKRSLDSPSSSPYIISDNNQITNNTTSIEGYIIQSKDSIRVAPITTIKNLSYFPFQQKNDNNSLSTADTDNSTIEEEELLSITGSITSEGIDCEHVVDYLSDEDNLDDNNCFSQQKDFVKTATVQQQPKSLFYSIWSTMDELFAYAFRVFDDDFDTENIINNIIDDHEHSVINMETSDDYITTTVVAARSEDEENGIIKLLVRGILIAEKRFELLNRYLLTNIDRDHYHKSKKKLISSTHKILRKSFISNVYTPQAASSLSSSGWILIGILVIDTILIKKKLGPFYGIKSNISSKDILEGDNIAANNWTEVVDKLVIDVVGTSALRKDDLRILRSFFETL